jgi:hypothetical protein
LSKPLAVLWLSCALGLAGCGDFPTPFKGNPGATATRLAQPTAPLLVVVTPNTSALPLDARTALAEGLAAALQAEEVPAQAKRPARGDWQLISTLDARGGTMVPVFSVRDPAGKDVGSVEGRAASADTWAVGSPDFLRSVSAEAAPRISALLTGIRIGRDRADPNSLLNRPARVAVFEVTGAPGDGNSALTRQVRQRLAAYGVVVQIDKDGADFLVRGDVVVAPTPNRKERVEIVWTVTRPSGEERGKALQLNEIPAGTLNSYWGEVAVAVATEASGALNDIVLSQTGRQEAAKAAAAAAKK